MALATFLIPSPTSSAFPETLSKRGTGFPVATDAIIGAPTDAAFVANLKKSSFFNSFDTPSLTLDGISLCSLISRNNASIKAILASSYPSKVHALMLIHRVFPFFSESTSIFCSINFRRVDFPAPQTPNTPIVSGL